MKEALYMPTTIEVNKQSVEALLGSGKSKPFVIPEYQRPYAWTEDETGALFDDLYRFFQTENTENFFLGSIVLIKNEQNRYADVIDGQQRLTTLSILAVLADTFDNEDYKMDLSLIHI